MKNKMKEIKRCEAVIYHGPGHQSKTHCQKKEKHIIHEAIYGRYDQYAKWEGNEVYSGYFDDPPELSKKEKR